MKKSNNNNAKWIWVSALILFVCVAATAIAFFSRLDGYLLDDEGAISLLGDGAPSDTVPTPAGVASIAPKSSAAPVQPPFSPGFEASDDKTVWNTDTQVEIFHVSYKNGENVITVNSDDGDKLIAPGTENSYTFKLKNTGNVALDYTVELDAYFTPQNIQIPITGRINRYDGKWIAGGKDAYAQVAELDAASDKATLGAGKYTYYTLDWVWPFERGEDELDTELGNLAVQQDLTFTIQIKTMATASDNPDDNSGILPPYTGDDFNLVLWSALAVGSFIIMLILIIYQKKERKREQAEAQILETK